MAHPFEMSLMPRFSYSIGIDFLFHLWVQGGGGDLKGNFTNGIKFEGSSSRISTRQHKRVVGS